MRKIIFIIFGLLALFAASLFLLARVGALFVREIAVSVADDAETEPADFGSVGSRAPHFVLPDLSGASVSLSDFTGAPLVVAFWTTWNGASVDQLRVLDEYRARERAFAVVAINNQEDKDAVAHFIGRGGYGVPVLLDEAGAVGEQYRVGTLPLLYFLDADGIVRGAVAGGMSESALVETAENAFR